MGNGINCQWQWAQNISWFSHVRTTSHKQVHRFIVNGLDCNTELFLQHLNTPICVLWGTDCFKSFMPMITGMVSRQVPHHQMVPHEVTMRVKHELSTQTLSSFYKSWIEIHEPKLLCHIINRINRDICLFLNFCCHNPLEHMWTVSPMESLLCMSRHTLWHQNPSDQSENLNFCICM